MTAAQEKLINDNYRLVPYCVKKFSNTYHSIDHDDMMSLAHIGLIRAAKTYDVSKGTFSTYVVNTVRLCLISELTRQTYAKRTAEVVPLNEFRDSYKDPESETAMDVRNTLERAMRGMDKQACECFQLRFVDGLLLREIGAIYGFSGERARQLSDMVAKRFKMFWQLSHRGEAV